MTEAKVNVILNKHLVNPVRMTETKLWTKIRPWFMSHGYAYRVDNVANTSPPDVTFVSDDHIYLIELKILHGNKVKFQPTQIALFSHISVAMNKSYSNPFVFGWDSKIDALRLVPFNAFKLFGEDLVKGALTWPLKHATEAVVHNSQELLEWLLQKKT